MCFSARSPKHHEEKINKCFSYQSSLQQLLLMLCILAGCQHQHLDNNDNRKKTLIPSKRWNTANKSQKSQINPKHFDVTPHYIGVDKSLDVVLLHLLKRSINSKTQSSFLIHKPNRLLPGHQDLPVQQELLSNAYKYNTQLLTRIFQMAFNTWRRSQVLVQWGHCQGPAFSWTSSARLICLLSPENFQVEERVFDIFHLIV